MSQGPLCPNLSQKVQKEVSKMANRNLSPVILLGGLSVNLNHLKMAIFATITSEPYSFAHPCGMWCYKISHLARDVISWQTPSLSPMKIEHDANWPIQSLLSDKAITPCNTTQINLLRDAVTSALKQALLSLNYDFLLQKKASLSVLKGTHFGKTFRWAT